MVVKDSKMAQQTLNLRDPIPGHRLHASFPDFSQAWEGSPLDLSSPMRCCLAAFGGLLIPKRGQPSSAHWAETGPYFFYNSAFKC